MKTAPERFTIAIAAIRGMGEQRFETTTSVAQMALSQLRGMNCSNGHAGAASLPLAELERRLAEVPQGRRVVAYCRGPYCVLAVEAVRLLRKRGVDAVRLKDGFPEGVTPGCPLKSSTLRRQQSQKG